MFFCLVSIASRRVVRDRCDEDAREELVEQARNLLTGVSATFAFFVGFAISMCWGAVTAGQSAVEQQSAAIQTMAWELRNIPDKTASTALLGRLTRYVQTAAALNEFEDAVNAYANGAGSDRAGGLLPAAAEVISSSAAVAAVANRGLPRPLAVLLAIVATLVTAVMGITTVTSGRSSVVFVFIWCLIPALSLTVVWALAYPFALRSGITVAPLRAVAQDLAGR